MAPPKPETGFTMKRKKTPFQKHQEEEELKRKRDAEEAARLFDEFAESFEADEKKPRMNFVSAGVQGAGSRPGEDPADDRVGKAYVPSYVPPGMHASFGGVKEEEKPIATEEAIALPPPARASGLKPRAIDSLMEEMMAKQEARDKAKREGRVEDAIERAPYSQSAHDEQSTNIHVRNLPLDFNENVLLRRFERFGPIGSVKIYWPRPEDLRYVKALSGFVAFMTHADAARAIEETDGVVVGGNDLRVGWGKAVKLPLVPIWPPPGMNDAHEREEDARAEPAIPSPPPPAPAPYPRAPTPPPGAPQVIVTYPSDAKTTHAIDTLARYVADKEKGIAFEQAVVVRERHNPAFYFLFNPECAEHAYYRWRVHSLSHGFSLSDWNTTPFYMHPGQPRWVPPDPAKRPTPLKPDPPAAPTVNNTQQQRQPNQPSTSGRDSAPAAANDVQVAKAPAKEEKETTKPGKLTDGETETFTVLLQALTLERGDIEEGMAFALDHAEAACDVVDILAEALTLSETPVAMKVARLFLVSDILHNCGAPIKNASAYRVAFQEKLPHIFESLVETHRDVSSRITREAFKKRVLAVLSAWSDWFLFADEFLRGLESVFVRGGLSSEPTLSYAETRKLRAEIDAMDPTERERACRARGLVSDGGPEKCAERLVVLETYLRSEASK